ncbi:MAG: hypothetical protein ACK6DI_06830 [Betaproteobacteria bacterium]
MNNVGGEPAGGDFVAFLEQLQKRQLHALAAPHRPVAPANVKKSGAGGELHKPLTQGEADALLRRLEAEDAAKRKLPGLFALLMAAIGVVALAFGAIDGFNLVFIVVGAWLRLRAGRSVVRALKGE